MRAEEAKITKSRALNFALNSPPILTILVVIRGQHIGFRPSNHLEQSTWRVLPRPPTASRGLRDGLDRAHVAPPLAGHEKVSETYAFR